MEAYNNSTQVTIVIPNWNTRRWLPGCLEGLRAQRYRNFETILVDSGSTDDSIPFVQANYPEVKILALGENRGFAGAVNAGIRHSRSKYVVLLNSDTLPRPDWLKSLVETIERSPASIGCLASKMLQMRHPELIDDAGDTLSWYGSARKRGAGQSASIYNREEEVFSACAGAALYRRTFLDEVGEFDEGFSSYLEDVDLGLRGRLWGYRCLYVPTAEILHQGQGAGTGRGRYVYLMTRNRLALIVKNIPLPLLVRYGHRLLYGQFYFFLVYKHPFHSLAGTLAFLLKLPRVLWQRRAIQQGRKIPNKVLATLLSDELGEPPLGEIVKAKVRLGY